MTFAEFRKSFSGQTRWMFKRKAISKSIVQDDSKMLIYSPRAMADLDDRDKSDNRQQEHLIRLAYTLDKLDEDDKRLKKCPISLIVLFLSSVSLEHVVI